MLLLSILTGATAAAAPAGDPVEGLWLGTAGSVREKVEIGLDVRRDAQGALRIFLTQPTANYFSLAMPGTVRREGEQVLLASFPTPRASRRSTARPASSCAASRCLKSPAPTSGASPARPPSPVIWSSSRRFRAG